MASLEDNLSEQEKGLTKKIAGSGKKAFTLIEMLIVIGVMGIMAGMLMPAISKAREKARQLECMNNMKNVASGLILYENDTHSLPKLYTDVITNRRTGETEKASSNLMRTENGELVEQGLIIEDYLDEVVAVFGISDHDVYTREEVLRQWNTGGEVRSAFHYRGEYGDKKIAKAILIDENLEIVYRNRSKPHDYELAHGGEITHMGFKDSSVKAVKNNGKFNYIKEEMRTRVRGNPDSAFQANLYSLDEMWRNADKVYYGEKHYEMLYGD